MTATISALSTINEDLYEAASIDGATPAQQFWKITLPLLRPTLLFCMVLSVIGTLQLFTEPALITNSGPGNATMTLGTYLYQQGFRSFNFGYASAIAVLLFAIVLAFFAAALLGVIVEWGRLSCGVRYVASNGPTV